MFYDANSVQKRRRKRSLYFYLFVRGQLWLHGAKQVSEEDWPNEELYPAYPKSKIKAETTGLEVLSRNIKISLRSTTVLPTLVMGPVFTNQGNTAKLVKDILEGSFPECFRCRIMELWMLEMLLYALSTVPVVQPRYGGKKIYVAQGDRNY